MKTLRILAAALALAAPLVHAESFFQIETGAGASRINDQGDGVWVQQGAPNNRERQTSPAFLVGLTGPLYARGAFDLRWHVDYVYLGEFSASVDGVPDDYYDPVHHKILPTWSETGARYSPFSGHGHMQGMPVTLDAGYTINGWRFGIEAGAWAYWQTWHESLYALDNEWHNLSRKTQMQVSYVVGASVARGPLALSYRFYKATGGGNPYPGLSSGANVLMLQYRF